MYDAAMFIDIGSATSAINNADISFIVKSEIWICLINDNLLLVLNFFVLFFALKPGLLGIKVTGSDFYTT